MGSNKKKALEDKIVLPMLFLLPYPIHRQLIGAERHVTFIYELEVAFSTDIYDLITCCFFVVIYFCDACIW